MNIERCYTRHGIRAHYAIRYPNELNIWTLCEKESITLRQRSPLFRNRLAHASVCSRCDEEQNRLSAA